MTDKLPEMVFEQLKDAPFQWAVCGGYAIDLFLDRTTRIHGDIDVCVFEKDRDAALKYMLDTGWNVYEFRGMGKVRKLNENIKSDAGRNLMCFKDGCQLVKFYPCEEEGMLYHEFKHVGIKDCDYIELLFNRADDGEFIFRADKEIKREIDKAIMYRRGAAYLAPEIVLLYKAAQPDRNQNRVDYERAYPHMSDGQKAWFMQSIEKLHPEGHIWTEKGQGV